MIPAGHDDRPSITAARLIESVIATNGRRRSRTTTHASDRGPVSSNDLLVDLGLDSLDVVILAVRIERITGRAISDGDLMRIRTVADLDQTLASADRERPPPAIGMIESAPQLSSDSATEVTAAAVPSAVPGALAGVTVADSAEIATTATVGNGTVIWAHCYVGSQVRIGEDCVLGRGAHVESGAVIGDRVKIQAHCGVYGATLADDVLLAPGVRLLEDPVPRASFAGRVPKSRMDWTAQPVIIGPGASLGASVTVAPGVRIGAHALVTIGAVVHRDLPDYALAAGHPARQVGWVCRCGHPLTEPHPPHETNTPTVARHTGTDSDVSLRCTACGDCYTLAPDGRQVSPTSDQAETL